MSISLPEPVNPHNVTLDDITGSVHSWELVTAVDGPGTRLTVFLSGCPLRCLYCHNPDTRYAKWGTTFTAASILDRVDRYNKIFKATNGGVTFSGGEPMMQPVFLSALINECHQRGVHVTLDTSGYSGQLVDDEVLKKVDLFLLDIKSGLPQVYKKTTARPLTPTLKFASRLKSLGKKIWVRFVLVPGLTDSVENVEALAAHVEKLGDSVEKVEILPFHQMGREKWERLNLKYTLDDTPTPSQELILRVKEQFESHGLKVMVG